ncbi:AraC family transcriptional regulator [Nocardioides mangrovicus]|uniref:AraC family transcriptional regulator n=1 Tax=Nocardioides mangrovicus TaxID=2478913 RepID=A0A3L8P0P7_9ACTN|nr:helix-turn-helix domain-containing protein [Nocardioides mangrovicus]RLV49025.1 AraC family transcriptional regulator [Nocardioides mangrovicus]
MDRPAGRDHGILRPLDAARRISLGRQAPPESLAGRVAYLWWVRWDVEEPYRQDVLPAPVVHVSVEQWQSRARILLTGPQSRRFEQRLEGRGRVVAAAFRPGCVRPYLGVPVSDLADRRVPLAEVVAADGVLDDTVVAERILDRDPPDEASLALLTDWLGALPSASDPLCEDLATLVERAEQDPSLTRAAQLADLAGVTLRTLQRQFAEYVGVGPKQVVQRFRLLDVAAVAHSGQAVDWAAVALELGYSDQSHLVRAFSRVVGEPPATYTRRASTPVTSGVRPPRGAGSDSLA